MLHGIRNKARKEPIMEKKDVLEIAEGLRLIEEGVEKIQAVMREKKIKSIQDVAAELIPFFKKDDDSLSESVIKHLGK
jgi:CCR4-NOT transcriptional regulation complex NOT5 subunit